MKEIITFCVCEGLQLYINGYEKGAKQVNQKASHYSYSVHKNGSMRHC